LERKERRSEVRRVEKRMVDVLGESRMEVQTLLR
jgi:hypothetical protein